MQCVCVTSAKFNFLKALGGYKALPRYDACSKFITNFHISHSLIFTDEKIFTFYTLRAPDKMHLCWKIWNQNLHGWTQMLREIYSYISHGTIENLFKTENCDWFGWKEADNVGFATIICENFVNSCEGTIS